MSEFEQSDPGSRLRRSRGYKRLTERGEDWSQHIDQGRRTAFYAGWGEGRTITPEQVEAAARALFAKEEPDCNDWRWNREHPTEGLSWHEYWLDAARAAFTAAGFQIEAD